VATYRIAESARIAAPAAECYAILADYRVGHPSVLPAPYFDGLDVEEGGVGAGTVIRFRMRMLGTTRTARARVTEPAPGRVLMETIPESNIVTTFTVVPDAGGAGCEVTIATEFPDRGGLLGAIERALVGRSLPRVYRKELALLAARAERRGAAAHAGADR
jgi:hypothetical protein